MMEKVYQKTGKQGNMRLAKFDFAFCTSYKVSSRLALEIVRGTRLFALDEREADEYDLFVLRRAGDLIPLERERAALVMGERSLRPSPFQSA